MTREEIAAHRKNVHAALVAASPTKPTLVETTLKCSTGKGDEKKDTDFQASMPASLGDAIAGEGVQEVFKRYLNSLAIELQGIERKKLQPEVEGKERKRAKYLEELGV